MTAFTRNLKNTVLRRMYSAGLHGENVIFHAFIQIIALGQFNKSCEPKVFFS